MLLGIKFLWSRAGFLGVEGGPAVLLTAEAGMASADGVGGEATAAELDHEACSPRSGILYRNTPREHKGEKQLKCGEKSEIHDFLLSGTDPRFGLNECV